MTLEEALKAQLVNHGPLNALIAGRVYPLVLSENAVLPAVTYTRISLVAINHRGGVSTLGKVRFQIDGWSTKYSEATTLRAHLKAALLPWQRADDPRVDAVFLDDDRDLREAPSNRFRASLDFRLMAEDS